VGRWLCGVVMGERERMKGISSHLRELNEETRGRARVGGGCWRGVGA
jgi:hypothetical protein